jgi:hypothetical protein
VSSTDPWEWGYQTGGSVFPGNMPVNYVAPDGSVTSQNWEQNFIWWYNVLYWGTPPSEIGNLTIEVFYYMYLSQLFGALFLQDANVVVPPPQIVTNSGSFNFQNGSWAVTVTGEAIA